MSFPVIKQLVKSGDDLLALDQFGCVWKYGEGAQLPNGRWTGGGWILMKSMSSFNPISLKEWEGITGEKAE